MRIKGYTDFSISKSGARSQFYPHGYWGVYFKLDSDVSDLFPFINAKIEDAQLFDRPKHIQFIHDQAKCTLYPREVVAAAFKNESEARNFADSLMAFLNGLVQSKKAIIPEYKPHRNVSPVDIYKLLPQTNCRKCGFPTCIAFAACLGRGMATPDQCPDFIAPLYHRSVYPVFDRNGNLRSTFSIETPSHKQSKTDFPLPFKDPYDSTQTKLTKREIQVLQLVAEGATNNEISNTLSISPHTVKSHVIHIFNKLNVYDRTQAAVWAIRNKII